MPFSIDGSCGRQLQLPRVRALGPGTGDEACGWAKIAKRKFRRPYRAERWRRLRFRRWRRQHARLPAADGDEPLRHHRRRHPAPRLLPFDPVRRRAAGLLPSGRASDRASRPIHARSQDEGLSAPRPRIDRGNVGQIFAKNGQRYTPTRMVAYTSGTQSGCGAAQAAMGPFYCPTDQKIYLDTDSSTSCRGASARPAISPRPM